MTSSKKILIVDDEVILLKFLAKHLSKFFGASGFQVLTATTTKEAIAVLSSEFVDVVVTDYRMPDATGLDLLYRIRSQWPGIEIIIMTGYCNDEVRDLAEKNGCRHIIEKPFDLSQFKDIILDIMAGKAQKKGFAGIVKSINLTDLIQMFCLDGASKSIMVRNEKEEGQIHIDTGEIIHASCSDMRGAGAFYKILCWRTGRFEAAELIKDPEINIFQNWQFLLMEGARHMDEQQSEFATDDH